MVGYNQRDVDVWKEVVVRGLVSAGIGADDVVQVSYGYGLFTGGLGLHYGAEALGATVVPASGGNTHRQVMLMKDFGVTVICCTPSYFIHLIDRAEAMGIDMKALALRFGIFGAEPWTQEMRRYIEAHTSIKALDIYGLSEIVGPGVAMECAAREGSHIFEDHFYPEIIDPESGEVLPDGEEGELVLTTLSKEAMPMMRYRTRDITSLDPGQCSCGRTLRRIRRITSRSDDMFIIRGVNVYPRRSRPPCYRLRDAAALPDHPAQREQPRHAGSTGGDQRQPGQRHVSGITALEKRIAKNLEQMSNPCYNNLVQPETLQRSEGKIQRVSDFAI